MENKEIIIEAIREFVDSKRIDIHWRIERLQKYLKENDVSKINRETSSLSPPLWGQDDYCVSDNYVEKVFGIRFTHCDKCENNKRRIYFKDFKDISSVKEYILSGMSNECQDFIFIECEYDKVFGTSTFGF